MKCNYRQEWEEIGQRRTAVHRISLFEQEHNRQKQKETEILLIPEAKPLKIPSDEITELGNSLIKINREKDDRSIDNNSYSYMTMKMRKKKLGYQL